MEKKTAKKAAKVTAKTAGGTGRTVLKVIITILLIIIVTGLLFTCIFAYYVKTNLSQDLDVSLESMNVNLASTIFYTDENGINRPLSTLHGTENREWVDYENIPVNLEHAAVAIEDRRFYSHKGVDWYRTSGAFIHMFLGMENEYGGSTVTQQLIKNLTKYDDVTVQRKLLEIFRALQFERMYSKQEIMEWYLNIIYLGESCNGVGTASQVYFGKEVSELTLAECASLISITNNPSKYDPYISKKNNKERRDTILNEMYEQGYITHDEYTQAINEEIVLNRSEDENFQTPINSYYVDAVIEDVTEDIMEDKGVSRSIAQNLIYNGGYQIYSCLDMRIQNIVDGFYKDPSSIPAAYFPNQKSAGGYGLQSAIVILDPYNGKIKALSGGIGAKTASLSFNRATRAQRPPGSSIKPIATYGPAVDQGLISPDTIVNDAPKIPLKGTNWYPDNAGNSYMGVVTIRKALVHSLNTVAAQILDKLKPSVSYQYLTERLGVTSTVDSDCNYAPLALGQLTNGITVREMAQAYSALVNDGVFTYGRTYSLITDSEGKTILDNSPETIVAFKANTAWTITDMLSDAATHGTGSESNFPGNMPHAGKTGSSTRYEDQWFVGYTPYYVAAVWTGFDSPQQLYGRGNPSARIWSQIMRRVHEGLPIKNFKQPTYIPPTGIFGNLKELETPSPSPSEEVSPSPDESEEPTDDPTDTPSTGTDVPTPTPPDPSEPVTPTTPPTFTPKPTDPTDPLIPDVPAA